MTAFLVSLVFAFGLSAAASFALARSTSRFWPRDEPNARSLHAMPTPRTGGLAVLLGLAAGLAASRLLEGVRVVPTGGALVILAATALVAATSFLDDLFDLPPAVRLALQALAAAVVIRGAGLAVTSVSIPGIGAARFGPLPSVLLFLGLVWMTNLYNFMDGLDGFAGGMTVIGGSVLALELLRGGDVTGGRLALVLAAAAAGFLLLNYPPARIFMGDSGAVTIGFLFGVLMLRGAASGAVGLAASLIAFSPFVVDATLTLVLRALRRESVWRAHRSHFYQRLVLAGWSHRRTVLAEYGLMLVSGAAALVYSRAGNAERAAVLAALAILFAGAIAGVRRAEARA